jgi:type IV secretory pathway TrbD component
MVKRAGVMLVAFLSVAAILGFMVAKPFGSSQDGSGGAARAPSDQAFEAAPMGVDEAAGGAAGAADAAVLEGVEAVSSELPGVPPLGQAVVKTAEVTVEVGKGDFAAAFDRAALVAGRYGGYVQSSQMAGAEARSGTLVIRVPSERFDEAMSDLRALGKVTNESVSGQVVTQEFIDLEARLRTWEAQESVLLGLMEDAKTVDSTLRIQRELQDVQFRIEQIKGQLRVLEDQTALATISLSMVETGAPIVVARADGARPSLAEAWDKAIVGVLGVAYATIVGLGYLVPLTALGLVVWFVARRLTRRVQASHAA